VAQVTQNFNDGYMRNVSQHKCIAVFEVCPCPTSKAPTMDTQASELNNRAVEEGRLVE